MRQFKRILCVLLLAVLLAVLTVPALAATPAQTQKVALSIPCTVTVDVGEHGKVFAKGTTYTGPTVGSFQVWPGTRVSFQITPDDGYVVEVLTLSGADVREGLRYGLYSAVIEHDETLLVRFEKGPSPTPSPTPSESPTPSTSPTPIPTYYPWPTPVPTVPSWQVTPPYGPKTGDVGNVDAWAALLFAAALGGIALMRAGTRRKK